MRNVISIQTDRVKNLKEEGSVSPEGNGRGWKVKKKVGMSEEEWRERDPGGAASETGQLHVGR